MRGRVMVTCPYCGNPARFQSGSIIYPHRADLAGKHFWACPPCDAYVGCHDGTDKPLGRLADRELRRAKMAAHAAFDPLWRGQSGKVRKAAYRWLAERLGIHPADCHIGMFNVAQCWRVVDVVESQTFRYEAKAKRAVAPAASEAL